MKLVNIAQRTVTVELDPEDCVRLATACRVAGDDLGAPAATHWVGPLYEALALGFDAAAMAAQAANALDDHSPGPVTLDAIRDALDRDRQTSA